MSQTAAAKRKAVSHKRIHDRIGGLGGEEEHTETLVAVADKEFRHADHPRSTAAGLCQLESGFRNIFGADSVRNPIKSQSNAHPLVVTEANYHKYLAYRHQGLGMQGVGWTQLTYFTFQDRADRLGGCWIVENQLIIGFGDLDALIRQYGLRDGLAAYNAGPGNRHSTVGQRYATLVINHIDEFRRLTDNS
jgi:hypothetical protein